MTRMEEHNRRGRVLQALAAYHEEDGSQTPWLDAWVDWKVLQGSWSP